MKKHASKFLIIALIAIIITSWLKYPQWIAILFKNSTALGTNFGTFGDSFGALNTLFSGLAFTGIIISIILQSKELQETRKDIKSQNTQFEIQNNSIKRQVFENTFFQLLNLHNEIIQSISLPGRKNNDITGRSAFVTLYNDYLCSEYFIYELRDKYGDHINFENTNEWFLGFHEIYGDKIGHYFRNIYQILKMIDKEDLKDKKFYSNLLRAQLNNYELGLLFFNCLSDIGYEKFKPLVEKYEFFEHLPLLDNITEEDIKSYNISAFGKTNYEFIEIHTSA